MQFSLVVQTSFLGDVVLTTPLISALRERGPVHVVTTPAAAPLLAGHPDVSALTIYDKRGSGRGVRGLAQTAAALEAARRRALDDGATAPVAYLAQGSVRSATLARLAGFRERVGFSTSAGRWLYTRRVRYRDDRHHAERLWSLAAQPADAVPDPDTIRPRLYPGDADRAAVDSLLASHGVGAHDWLIALAPGSVWATKRWPEYAALAPLVPRAARLVVIGAASDAPLAAAIADARAGTIDATGRLGLLGSAELIRRCTALVTNDSAPQHLASAVNTPTLTIFGPTVPDFGFGPLAPGSATAGVTTLACRPCDRHGPPVCPLGHWRCMRDLGPTTIAASLASLGHAS